MGPNFDIWGKKGAKRQTSSFKIPTTLKECQTTSHKEKHTHQLALVTQNKHPNVHMWENEMVYLRVCVGVHILALFLLAMTIYEKEKWELGKFLCILFAVLFSDV